MAEGPAGAEGGYVATVVVVVGGAVVVVVGATVVLVVDGGGLVVAVVPLRTVNAAVALVAPAVAVALAVPAGADGTRKVAVKPPLPLVFVVATVVDSNRTVTCDCRAKSVPITFTDVPTVAEVGLRVIAGAVAASAPAGRMPRRRTTAAALAITRRASGDPGT